jgi:hypothetical protein
MKSLITALCLLSVTPFAQARSSADNSTPQHQIVCTGEIEKITFNPNDYMKKTGESVQIKFLFNLNKAKTYKSFAGVLVYEAQAIVEERIYNTGENALTNSPIVHSNVTLKWQTLDKMFFFYGLNLSLGLAPQKTFSEEQSAAFIYGGEGSGGTFVNKQTNIPGQYPNGSDFRTVSTTCKINFNTTL